MGAFGISSSSDAQDNRILAQGAESAVARGQNSMTVRDNGFAIGKDGKFISTGGYDLSKVKLAKGATLNITSSDPAVLQGALDRISELGKSNSSNFAEILKQIDKTQQGNSKLFTDLSESRQTDGESGRNKTILYIMVSLFAAVAIYFWPRK